MFRELPLFLLCWSAGLSIILMPSFIVKLFGKEVEDDD
jgi:hypothetical protein